MCVGVYVGAECVRKYVSCVCVCALCLCVCALCVCALCVLCVCFVCALCVCVCVCTMCVCVCVFNVCVCMCFVCYFGARSYVQYQSKNKGRQPACAARVADGSGDTHTCMWPSFSICKQTNGAIGMLDSIREL
jgi:hypothetical protein